MATGCGVAPVDPGGKVAFRRRRASDGANRKPRRTKSEGIPGERRFNTRYRLELEFELYELRGANHLIWSGSGTTVDWSRNSVLIRSEGRLEAGNSAQLVVRWFPGVELVVIAKVTQADERGMVLKILRKRFRGRPALMPAPAWTAASMIGRPN